MDTVLCSLINKYINLANRYSNLMLFGDRKYRGYYKKRSHQYNLLIVALVEEYLKGVEP